MADTVADRTRTLVLVTALLCALTVSGCAGSPQPGDPAPGATAGASRAVARGTSGAGDGTATARGGPDATEIGWIQLMIALDGQARHILRLAPGRAADRNLTVWAAGVAEHHRRELVTLRALLADAGVPDDNPHEGHDMPGMADAAELRALTGARGTRFDRLLRSALREHLVQARKLATAVRSARTGPAVRDLARTTAGFAADALRRMPAG
ncbi:DUF305 domain-containing protein [Streptomyces sp. NPDC093094]|uniref:DUF305 domain-containing protein n=1 Tax=Streptomyces sp. NPDC093094 TaxID=3366026 RepID=UPI0038170EA9